MVFRSSRLNNLSTGIFNQLLQLKEEQLKLGKNVIDLSIGSPDLKPPTFFTTELANAVQNDHLYRYAMTSTAAFNEAVISYYQRKFEVTIEQEDILQLMGSQDGLAHLSLAYLDQGDVALVPDPGYPIYSASVHVAGGELYCMPLKEENHFLPVLEDIPADICERAKFLIIGYPGNPIPAVATFDFFEKLIAFGKKYNILIIHDFAYCELLFDKRKPQSILSVPGAFETAIEINSLSKSFNVAGSRIGFIVGKPSLIEPLKTLKSHFDYGVFLPIQQAATKALLDGDEFLEGQRIVYEERRNFFIDELHKADWNVFVPEGGMFVWAKIPKDYTSFDFTKEAINNGVIVTPGDAFGASGEGYIRIAMVQEKELLQEAARRLGNIK